MWDAFNASRNHLIHLEKTHMRSLVIGLGIGNLYKTVLESAGHEVTTVDTNAKLNPDFVTLKVALQAYQYDTVHICTPNFTHYQIAREVAAHNPRIVFIEKPGVQDDSEWKLLVWSFPNVRFMMVKNNQYRNTLGALDNVVKMSDTIKLSWINKNRVPSPGSWFTTKNLAYGGVSRDLLPHLLSFVASFDSDFSKVAVTTASSYQNWNLDTVGSTDYGTVNKDGTYDVDDRVELTLVGDREYLLVADWKDDKEDYRRIDFIKDNEVIFTYDFGLCPEDAYLRMIETAFRNLNNQAFWSRQFEQDTWIHELMELF